MKTNFLKSVLLIACLFGIISSASAETVHANIPFDFSLNGKAMSGGFYAVRPLSGSPYILLFVNESTGEQALAFARTTRDNAGKSGLALTIKTAEKSYELSQSPVHGSTKTNLLTLSPAK